MTERTGDAPERQTEFGKLPAWSRGVMFVAEAAFLLLVGYVLGLWKRDALEDAFSFFLVVVIGVNMACDPLSDEVLKRFHHLPPARRWLVVPPLYLLCLVFAVAMYSLCLWIAAILRGAMSPESRPSEGWFQLGPIVSSMVLTSIAAILIGLVTRPRMSVIRCPRCPKRLRVPEGRLLEVKCPGCKAMFRART